MEHDSARATWFNENLDEIPKPMEKLLREYAGIPADQIKQHVLGIVSYYFKYTKHVTTQLTFSSAIVPSKSVPIHV